MGEEFFYSVGDAVNARTENLHWILDISSRWSWVIFLCSRQAQTRLEFRAKSHVIAALFRWMRDWVTGHGEFQYVLLLILSSPSSSAKSVARVKKKKKKKKKSELKKMKERC